MKISDTPNDSQLITVVGIIGQELFKLFDIDPDGGIRT